MSTSDDNSEDGNLLFIVNEAPTHGHLESTDNPGKPVTLFTQLEISGFIDICFSIAKIYTILLST